MALKDLTVHLDSGERTRSRLSLAAGLARKHQARLVGLFGQRAHAHQVGVVSSWPSEEYKEAASASKAAFEEATADLPGAQWRDVNRGGDAELLRHVIEVARHEDLMVLGQPDEDRSAHVPVTLAEEVVIQSGRPVLVVPRIGDFPQVAQRPVIAWDGTPESEKALTDALPLIQGCPKATLIALMTGPGEVATGCEEAASRLGCHLVEVRTEVLAEEQRHIVEVLLSRGTDLGADLLVVGAHRPGSMSGHGIIARDVVRHMVIPVLVSSCAPS